MRSQALQPRKTCSAPPAPEHDPEKWVPVFGQRSCSNKKMSEETDSTQLNQSLAKWSVRFRRPQPVVHLPERGHQLALDLVADPHQPLLGAIVAQVGLLQLLLDAP